MCSWLAGFVRTEEITIKDSTYPLSLLAAQTGSIFTSMYSTLLHQPITARWLRPLQASSSCPASPAFCLAAWCPDSELEPAWNPFGNSLNWRERLIGQKCGTTTPLNMEKLGLWANLLVRPSEHLVWRHLWEICLLWLCPPHPGLPHLQRHKQAKKCHSGAILHFISLGKENEVFLSHMVEIYIYIYLYIIYFVVGSPKAESVHIFLSFPY